MFIIAAVEVKGLSKESNIKGSEVIRIVLCGEY
jgi:hypothetical protein